MIRVIFLGVLADISGVKVKYYAMAADTGILRLMIEDDYPEIAVCSYRISVNNQIINSETELKDNDEVALMPPFAGG